MIYRLDTQYFVRPLQESDVDGDYPNWFEDQETTRYSSHGKFFITRKAFQDYCRDLNSSDKMVWAICHEKDGHVGNISLQAISMINRNAEFAIILGNKSHRGKGLGLLAGAYLVEHGFKKLNLERIYCGTSGGNKGMQGLALALGMKEEGRRRKHLFLNGAWEDVVEYGLLLQEWKGLDAALK